MNYYFMPRLDGLIGDVTLANFPPNDGQVPLPPDQLAHVAWSDGTAWHVRALDKVVSGETVVYSENELPDAVPDEALPFFFLHPDPLNEASGTLPTTPHMKTSPSWRGNIRLRAGTMSVSYQGEYPSDMLPIPTGTLLSIGPLLQNAEGVFNKFLLFNMRANPDLGEATLRFSRASDRTILKTVTARFNSCSVIELDDLDIADDELIAVTSDGITGIPLYLAHDRDFSHMSLEHTHPPAEAVVFGDRIGVQQSMKMKWLSAIGAAAANGDIA